MSCCATGPDRPTRCGRCRSTTAFDVRSSAVPSSRISSRSSTSRRGRSARSRRLRAGSHAASCCEPARFVPIAEESSLIIDLDVHMIRQVCDAARQLRDLGRRLPMHVNVSARIVSWHGFVRAVLQALDESGIEPSDLTLELTETAAMRDPAAGLGLLELAKNGVTLAMDDFGSAYSSVARLRALPASVIKIDRALVQAATGELPMPRAHRPCLDHAGGRGHHARGRVADRSSPRRQDDRRGGRARRGRRPGQRCSAPTWRRASTSAARRRSTRLSSSWPAPSAQADRSPSDLTECSAPWPRPRAPARRSRRGRRW